MRPAAHHRDPVTGRHRLGLVVGDEHRRRPDRTQQRDDVAADLGAKVRVEAGERLVEQHQGRCRRHRPGQSDTLALTTGQLVRVAAPVARQTDEIEPSLDAPVAFGARHVAQPEARCSGPR